MMQLAYIHNCSQGGTAICRSLAEAGGQGRDETAQTHTEHAGLDDKKRDDDDAVARLDRCTTPPIEKVKSEENEELYNKREQSHRDLRERQDEAREVNFGDDPAVPDERLAGAGENLGDEIPKRDAGVEKEEKRDVPGRHPHDEAEDDGENEGGNNGLDEKPERTENRLLLDGDQIATDEHPKQLAVLPDLAKRDVEERPVRRDDLCPVLGGGGHFRK
jgi:hypothetical protein